MPPERLSPHFALAEFTCRDGTRAPALAVPALRKLCRFALEPLREEFGRTLVTSGYRTATYNRRVGGAPLSHHVYDWHPRSPAADVKPQRGRPADWHRFLDDLGVGGLGMYAWHVHVDLRDVRARW